MKLLAVFRISLREQLRSPWDLALTLALAPLFLWMYWAFVGGGSTSFTVAVLNRDQGPLADQAIAQLREVTYPNGDPLLKVVAVDDQARAEQMLRDRAATVLVIFSPGFSAALEQSPPPAAATSDEAEVTFVGDLRNSYYSPAAIMASATLDSYVRQLAGQPYPLRFAEIPLGGSAERTEFEQYVPGLLIAAGTMMLFSIAIALTRQVEAGTVRRLQITRMTGLDLLGGVSLLYLLISLLTTALAFATALALGFRSVGPLWLAVLICAVTGVSVIGVGLVTAAVSGTTTRAAIVVNFPLIMLLFFSGAVFPLGSPPLFTLGGRTIGLFDLLPQTHAVLALNKVLSLGVGPEGVLFELTALVVLSALYFLLGVALSQRMHLRAR